MSYYVASLNKKNYLLTKDEWVDFSSKNKAAQARKFDDFAEADKIYKKLNKKGKPITYLNVTNESNKIDSIDKDDEFLCFYDSEFNACDYNDGKPQEVVSIGIVITNNSGKILNQYYSTIKLKAKKVLTRRCKKITKLTNNDLKDAPTFYNVCEEISALLERYDIKSIYALGGEDKKQFIETSRLYQQTRAMRSISKMFIDIRIKFKRYANEGISSLSLEALKRICDVNGNVSHNALDDAKDLATVWFKIRDKSYSVEEFKTIMEERRGKQIYSSARNIKDGYCGIIAPENVLQAKDTLIDFLSNNRSGLEPMLIKAIIDDLNVLFVKEQDISNENDS